MLKGFLSENGEIKLLKKYVYLYWIFIGVLQQSIPIPIYRISLKAVNIDLGWFIYVCMCVWYHAMSVKLPSDSISFKTNSRLGLLVNKPTASVVHSPGTLP